jgi:glutaminyl-peptide cyclotransferase
LNRRRLKRGLLPHLQVYLTSYSGDKKGQMRTDLAKYFVVPIVLLQVTWASSCSGGPGSKPGRVVRDNQAPVENPAGKIIKMISPEENAGFRLHQPVKVVLGLSNESRSPDSVVVSFEGKRAASLKSAPWEYSIPQSYTVTTGRKSIKVTPFREGKQQNPVTRFIVVYSDVVPVKYGYKVVHVYPHDKDAFTQGLFYDDGVLYEGTGQKTGSSLREVELETGRVIRQHNLDPSLFGEGITLYNNRIYQVTWENKIGFVYDRATFNVINKFYYSSQGWGLTTVGDKIVMSDGSNTLAYYEPEMFTMVSSIEVYDNEKKVESLNELEYINGEIWANIWQSDLIARIDPVSGKVLGYINMAGILPESERGPETDVLNGIAYDKVGKRIFVTGKMWPKLFEIRITE